MPSDPQKRLRPLHVVCSECKSPVMIRGGDEARVHVCLGCELAQTERQVLQLRRAVNVLERALGCYSHPLNNAEIEELRGIRNEADNFIAAKELQHE